MYALSRDVGFEKKLLVTYACKGEIAKKGPSSVPDSSDAAEMDGGTNLGD